MRLIQGAPASRHFLTSSIAVVLAAASATAIVNAQEQDDKARTGFALEEIIVTATRREAEPLDVPIAITALSADALARFNINDVSNLQQLVPGLQIRDNGVDGQGSIDINVRGIGNSNFIETGESNTSFNLDGVYTSRPQAALQLFNDVLRVEVARGPQGTLSGRNATAGAINVINRKPGFAKIDGYVEVKGGNYNTMGVKGLLNLPISDTFALRFNYADYQRDSFYRLIRDRDSRAAELPTDFSGANIPEFETAFGDPTDDGPGSPGSADLRAYRISALWKLADNLSWQLTYENYSNDAVGKPFTLDCNRADCEAALTAEQIGQAAPFTAFLSLRGQQDQDIENLRSVIEYSIDSLFDIKYVYGRSDFEHTLVQDLDAGVGIELVFADRPWLNDSQVHDLQFASNGSGSLSWVAGFFYFQESTDRTLGVSFFPFGWQAFPNPNYEVKTQAAYSDFTYAFSENLELFAGLRYSKDEKSNFGTARFEFAANSFACPGALAAADPKGRVFLNAGLDLILSTPQCFTTSTESEPTDESFIDFRLGLRYNLNQDVNLYASVSSGHKAALQTQHILNTRAGGFLDIPVATEEVINWEIGSKGKLFGGRINYAAAVFFADFSNKQEALFLNFGDIGCDLNGNGLNDALPRNGATNIQENAFGCGADEPFSFDTITDLNDTEFPDQIDFSVTNADLEVYGFELEASATIGKNGFLSGFLTWTDAKYTSFNYSHVLGCPNPALEFCNLRNIAGNEPRSTPEFTLNLTYTHTFNFANGAKLAPTVNLYYRSSYFLTPENIRAGVDPSVLDQQPLLDAAGNALGPGNPSETELFVDRQKSSVKFNVNITYTSPKGNYDIQLFGANIFDEEVRSHARIDTAQTPGFVYEDPAQFGASLRYRFN